MHQQEYCDLFDAKKNIEIILTSSLKFLVHSRKKSKIVSERSVLPNTN